ncbi:putative GTPase activating protein [Trypanosoma grayi]|uniref:putative GTPase activating protein n=1 Tax=Trypanosoma grayi TaxID=71804 RepID=UPI0004F465E1|nr:putative GTPase activating protein [Trypanosoma grayi]KEG10220.1 putative GTPase activating protein [Trypanosoma grayi]
MKIRAGAAVPPAPQSVVKHMEEQPAAAGTKSSGGIGGRRMKSGVGGERETNHGVGVFLLSTHRIPHALKPQSSTTWVSTRLVEQCVEGYRDALLLAREYGQKTEAERMQLRMHLLRFQQQHQTGDSVDENGPSPPLIVERQLWEFMLRKKDTHPALLSESLRYQQILQDMNHLARGLLAPVDILRHRNSWLLLLEDVQLNLADRLFHYRVVVRRSPPAALAERLWRDLWSLLGAAWRQRERLLGVYAEGIPPVKLDGDASQLPPPIAASPALRDAYRERQREYHSRHAGSEPCVRCGVTRHEEDVYAFGPLLPHRVGVTMSRRYAIRAPLLAVLRSLRVQVWETQPAKPRGSYNASVSSAGAVNNVGTTVPSSSVTNHFDSLVAADVGVGSRSVAFFDPTAEDVEACRVPYLSPQHYTRLRGEGARAAHDWDGAAIAHTFSDDAWNAAVLTVEFMLAGFPLGGSCCGHCDHHVPPTGALFEDVVQLLVVHHGTPLEAAQNFIYAALHELSLLLLASPATLRLGEKGRTQSGPSPQGLAEQWYRYLHETYEKSENITFLREVAENGLRWSQCERWEAFQTAHAHVVHDSAVSSEDNTSVSRDSAQRVLDGLMCPFLPLYPMLSSAAAMCGVDVESFMPEVSLPPPPLDPSLWELHMQLQLWRKSIERHIILDSGCRKESETRRTILFKHFFRVIRRAIQLRLQKDETEKISARGSSAAAAVAHTNTSPTQLVAPLSHAKQYGLLLELIERGALFSYRRNGCLARISSSGDDNMGDDSFQVFPLSHVFLPLRDVVSLLRDDVTSLTVSSSSSSAAAVSINALDSIVGVKHAATRDLPSPLPSAAEATTTTTAAAGKGFLVTTKATIRAVDLSVAAQLTLVTDLRSLLLTTPAVRRASLVRRYLIDAQIVAGAAEVPVPAIIRGVVWGALLLVPPESARVSVYHALNTARPSAADRQLAVDIPRCHQYHPLLASVEGNERLGRIIKAWLLLNRGLTYWQGMDSVCAILLAASFTDEALVAAQLEKLTLHYIPHDTVTTSSTRAKSMEDHLHQFTVLLRYCDPLLAVHLLDEVECLPELFAISWFLTLLAHGLPVGKTYLLWDFLFVYSDAYPHCLTVLCLAVLLQHRERLLRKDLSVCLTTLRRVQGIDVSLVLRDTAAILRAVPPAVALLPYHSAEWGAEVRCCNVSRMDVPTILKAFRGAARCGAAQHVDDDSDTEAEVWAQAGVFLVDLRTERVTAALPQQLARTEERVVGALLFPLAAPSADLSTPEAELTQRLVGQHATELLLQTRNAAMAAIPPSPSAKQGGGGSDNSSAAVRECTTSPHIVLFTQTVIPTETAVAESLALELVRCGAPNVSILLGGFAQLKCEAPHLIVEVEKE